MNAVAGRQIQIRRFLESVYGLKVTSVHTVNYEGKKKRRKTGFFRTPDYKKVGGHPMHRIAATRRNRHVTSAPALTRSTLH